MDAYVRSSSEGQNQAQLIQTQTRLSARRLRPIAGLRGPGLRTKTAAGPRDGKLARWRTRSLFGLCWLAQFPVIALRAFDLPG